MKKAIVTGANGFIGKALAKQLINRGGEVYAVVRENATHLEGLEECQIIGCDLKHYDQLPELIEDRNIDIVFHIAWQGVSSGDSKDAQIQLDNVAATLKLLDAMHEMGIGTIVGAGSIHEIESMVEVAQDKPISNFSMMYKAGKVTAHCMAKTVAGHYGIKFLWPIIINAYGEGEHTTRLINYIIKSIYKGESPKLSSGTQLYEFMHVEDVARAFCEVAERGLDGKNYIIGSGEARPLREQLEIVGKIANEIKGGSPVPLQFGINDQNAVSLPLWAFDTTNMQQDIGFKPQISLEEGIRRTAQWLWEECVNSKE